MDDKCILDPERDCLGVSAAKEVASDVRALDNRLREFQQSVSDTNSRFGSRIGELEANAKVSDANYRHLREKMDEFARDMSEFQQEQKGSFAELRAEHKESMTELKNGNKEILATLSPMRHEVEKIPVLEREVDELKEKPGKTWEDIKSRALGWGVLLVLAIVAAALGLSQYL